MAHIAVRDLVVAYTIRGRRQTVLHEVSLDIPRGGFVSLIGVVVGTSASAPGVPTALSVFIPVMVLLPVAIAMVSRVKS